MSGKEVEKLTGYDYEVHFKRRHLPDHPSDRGIQWPPKKFPKYQNRLINVDRFCHDTHRSQYEEIRPGEKGDCTMIPGMKTRKQVKGETYTQIDAHAQAKIKKYRRIEADEAVLPGYYSWWSIHVGNKNNPFTPDGIIVSDLFYKKSNESKQISTGSSRYGSKQISMGSSRYEAKVSAHHLFTCCRAIRMTMVTIPVFNSGMEAHCDTSMRYAML